MDTRRGFGFRLAAFSALLASRSAMAAEQTLRFGSISVAGNPTYVQTLEPFARAIERESGGRLEVALKPAGGYGKLTELVPMVEKGEIEMATVLQGYYPGRFPESSVIELPLMFDNSVAGTKALNALYQEALLAEDYASLKVLALNVVPPYALFTTGRKITSLRDLRGLRIRVPGATVGLAMARLGAIPLGMPVGAMGGAIASGAVDGLLFTMDSTIGTKGAGDKYLYEQLSVVADLRIAGPAQVVAMNQATWNALSADLRTAIEKCASAYVADGVRYREDSEVAAARTLQANPNYTFMPFSAQLREEMRVVMAPVFDDWKADMGRRGIDGERLLTRTRDLVKQFSVASR